MTDLPTSEMDDEFLVARVSRDGKVIGIDHPTDADWQEVLHAHHVLLQRLADRLVDQGKCPFKPRAGETK